LATIGYAGLPIPGGGDAPTTPGDFAELATVIDPHLVQFVTDQAERDSLYATAPVHTVVSAANGTVWKKTSSGPTWVTWWEPTPAWRPLSLASGIVQYSENTPAVRRIGQRVYMQGAVTKADGTTFSGDAIKVGSVPSDCIPEQMRRDVVTCSLAGDITDAAVRLEITGKTNDTPGTIQIYYQLPTGTPWVDLSSDYWMDY
jgi:hypothetical protein